MIPNFSPPSEREKSQALGALGGSNFSIRKALSNLQNDFSPIETPSPDDWLAQNFEPGQTYEQFKPYANIPSKNSKIYIQPYDNIISLETIIVTKKYCNAFFPGVKFIIRRPINIEDLNIEHREVEWGKQFSACQILNKMYQIAPLDRFAIIGVTMADIYSGEASNFVFGLANVITKSGIFSFARYSPSFYGEESENENEIIIYRAVKVMIHEIGHMFGLLHCIYYSCIMNGSNHIEENDRKPLHLCPICLRKLHHCLNFNPIERYHNLEKFCRELGGKFLDQAEWYSSRASTIEKSLPKLRK
ncbi:unnamed protein product [Blepharisma stoltei]|uniref:Archaemetzincin-2 n=1 Tax=Blepharisma stoltei TaxID=1481888 RepID=A0AAU9K5T9_9CILI|nr:unnamed protein product [Blepharisma stoltei]